ncbi:MAG: metallophosphoesterase [Bacillota bacterium]|nr:metallophosphoesterase [Bacillota bacterium]
MPNESLVTPARSGAGTTKRRRLAAAALACLAVAGLWTAYCSTSVVVERVEVQIAGLPAAFDGFVVVQITDLHGRRFGSGGPLVAAIRTARPDIIAATGDYVDRSTGELTNIGPLFEALVDIAPVYAVSGNHDYLAGWSTVAAFLRQCGVVVLENKYVELDAGGNERLILAGVSDPATRRHDLAAAIPPDREAPPGTSAPVILLAHAPTLHQRLRDGDDAGDLALLDEVALTLAGHTHGGQIKLPLIGAMSNASGRPFPRSYVEGLSWEGHGWLYISRGLGYTILPLRFLSRPELTIVTLRSGRAGGQ